jgi:PKD repeat protein
MYGSYDVSLKVENTKGCIKTQNFSNLIEVEKIMINITATEFSGCLPFDVSFMDATSSIRPLVDWSWSFGDGNFANIQNPAHQYITSGVFDVSLFAMNDYGCVANVDFTAYIEANEVPQAEFEAAPFISCAGEDINFFDISTSTSSVTSWEWDFGDGSISNLQNPIYQYQLTGSYDVSLIVGINSCKDTFSILNYIEIIEPTAIFIETYNCDSPLKVVFESVLILLTDKLTL